MQIGKLATHYQAWCCAACLMHMHKLTPLRRVAALLLPLLSHRCARRLAATRLLQRHHHLADTPAALQVGQRSRQLCKAKSRAKLPCVKAKDAMHKTLMSRQRAFS